MMTVCKTFNFCYAHFLPGYDGKCSNVHGHNSKLEVEFREGGGYSIHNGIDYPGILIDFGNIKKYVQPLIDEIDHKFLNVDILQFDHIAGKNAVNPTAENIVKWFVYHIQKMPLMPPLVRCRVYETPTSYAEWRED